MSWNVVWPAIYVTAEIQNFWFLVFVTISIEALALMALCKFGFQKAVIAAGVGNLVSGLIGTFIMMFAMLFWHLIMDDFIPKATFDPINWVATYVLMCLGSVALEVFTVKLIYKETFKKLFMPLLVGNLLTYSFIAYTMTTESKNRMSAKKEEIYYSPNKNRINLISGSRLDIFTAKLEYSQAKEAEDSYYEYPLEILFQQEGLDSFTFNLDAVGAVNSGGIESNRKILRFSELSDTIKVLLKQKNPNPDLGWKKPLVTDTILFIDRVQLKNVNNNSYTTLE